jgi:hypothetical protein
MPGGSTSLYVSELLGLFLARDHAVFYQHVRTVRLEAAIQAIIETIHT